MSIGTLLGDPAKTQSFFDRIKARLIYLVVAAALEFAAYKWPNFPLPSPQTISDWAMALLATHGIGDVIKLVKEYIQTAATAK
jgi:hypothetical protein